MTPQADLHVHNASLDMGWGRLLFADSFDDGRELARVLCEEVEGARDLAFDIRDPHVAISHAPHELFLDPSHSFALPAESYAMRAGQRRTGGRADTLLSIREFRENDLEAINALLAQNNMVTLPERDDVEVHAARRILVAESKADAKIVGTVTEVDHVEAYGDPRGGSSFWCLAVDPTCGVAGVGEHLTRRVCERMFERGRSFVALSVMHDNTGAIELYSKLGFQRVPTFTIKRRNPINRSLFVPAPPESMNPYAEIIVDEAQGRGISIDIVDRDRAIFDLRFGGRSVRCRESLSELTSAVAYETCQDKRWTHEVLTRAGIRMPPQATVLDHGVALDFVAEHGPSVLKPARGEQGKGISIGVSSSDELKTAIERAREVGTDVIIEREVHGQDLRVVVIGQEVVAAALRRPPSVTGDGRQTVRDLISRYNRRRSAATGGESQVPIDDETTRCLKAQGTSIDRVPDAGREVVLRRTANLHTGGTIHDVTDQLHPNLAEVAQRCAAALKIPVVGIDLFIDSVKEPNYWCIEANERPGLANHEPQPTAERFVDLLFPETARVVSE